jgi:hypothetical protein
VNDSPGNYICGQGGERLPNGSRQPQLTVEEQAQIPLACPCRHCRSPQQPYPRTSLRLPTCASTRAAMLQRRMPSSWAGASHTTLEPRTWCPVRPVSCELQEDRAQTYAITLAYATKCEPGSGVHTNQQLDPAWYLCRGNSHA